VLGAPSSATRQPGASVKAPKETHKRRAELFYTWNRVQITINHVRYLILLIKTVRNNPTIILIGPQGWLATQHWAR
jgi:hypothetical protein